MNLKTILYAGIQAQSRPSDRRNIVLTNALCLIISAAGLSMIAIRYLFFLPQYTQQLLFLSTVMLIPVIANYFRYVKISQILLSWLPTLLLYGIYINELKKLNVPSIAFFDALKIYLIALSAVPFLTLSLRTKRLYLLGISLPLIGILFCHPILEWFEVGPVSKGINDAELNFNSIRTIVSFSILGASCLALRRLVDLSESMSEQRYLELFQINPVPMFILDNQSLRFLDINEAAVKHYGFSRHQFLNSNISMITHKNEVTLLTEWLHSSDMSTFNRSRVWRQVKSTGEPMEVEFSCHNIDKRDTDALMVMVNDVTAQQLATRQMQQMTNVINTSSLVSRTNLKGIITEVNQNLLTLSEYRAGELIGQSHKILDNGFHNDTFWDDLIATIKTGKTWHGEVRNISKSGNSFWIDNYIYPLFQSDGTIQEYLSIGKDITKRKKIEIENRKLALIARHTTNAIIITNEKGEIEWVNDGFTRITEYHLNEVIGKKPGDFLQGEETNQQTVEIMRNALLKGQGFRVEIINYSKTKRRYWLDIDCVPLYTEDKLTGFIAVELDITKLKDAVHNLTESEYRFRTLTNELNVGVLLQDLHDEILFSNPAAHELLGLTEAQLLGKSSFDPDWQVIHSDGSPFLPDDRPSVKALQIQQSVYNIPMGVYRPRTKDWIWLLTSAVPLFDEDKNIKQVIVSFTNITREKEYQKELKQSLHEKELLIKEIHHRVKNNLQLISSMLYLKMQTWHAPEAKEFMNSIREKIKSISLIHERLLQSETVDSVEIKDYLIKLLQNIKSAYNHLDVQLNIHIQIKNNYFTTDNALYLGQLVNELVTNAFKHAFTNISAGEIKVTLYETENGFELIVQDNGVGLPANIDVGKSTSFGMQLIQIFVNQLKVQLTVERNTGTIFKIEF